jgi:hypothetical protein
MPTNSCSFLSLTNWSASVIFRDSQPHLAARVAVREDRSAVGAARSDGLPARLHRLRI